MAEATGIRQVTEQEGRVCDTLEQIEVRGRSEDISIGAGITGAILPAADPADG
jgi:hypothetical protein